MFNRNKVIQRRKTPSKKKGKTSVKNKIRSQLRLLSKVESDSSRRKAVQHQLESLKEVEKRNKQAAREKRLAVRYHKTKFFERKKIARSIDKLKREIAGTAATEALSNKAVKLAQLEEDLKYVKHFPKGEKYVSLLKEANEPESQAHLEAERERLRTLVRQQLADEALLAEENEGRPKEEPRLQTTVEVAAKAAPGGYKIQAEKGGSGKIKAQAVEAELAAGQLIMPAQNCGREELEPKSEGVTRPNPQSHAEEDDFFLPSDAEEHSKDDVKQKAATTMTHQARKGGLAGKKSNSKENVRKKRKQLGHGVSFAMYKRSKATSTEPNKYSNKAPHAQQRTRAEGGRKRRKKAK